MEYTELEIKVMICNDIINIVEIVFWGLNT